MTKAQKIIKYLAIGFAIFLIVSIFSGILGALYGLSGILGLKKEEEKVTLGDQEQIVFETTDISELEISLAFTNLTIKTGDMLKVETNNKYIESKEKSNGIYIKEERHNWISNKENLDLTLYIPENTELGKVKINAGAGKVTIESLNASKLDFEIGAGETKIENINIFQECDIEGGAGKLVVRDGEINNLNLDMGIGEVDLSARLLGKSDINAGVGKLNINLQSNKEDYSIKAEKGIGQIKIDGRDIGDDSVYGSGDNYIKIDGGIGSIEIDFE